MWQEALVIILVAVSAVFIAIRTWKSLTRFKDDSPSCNCCATKKGDKDCGCC